MDIIEAQEILSGVAPEKVEKIFDAAKKAVKRPKPEKYVEENEGRYNTIAPPFVPAMITGIKDASEEEMSSEILGQQVICSRDLVAPVEVSYIVEADAKNYRRQLIVELRRRSKG